MFNFWKDSSSKYKRTFLTRFSAYFFILLSTMLTLFEFGPLLSTEFNYRKDKLFNVNRTVQPLTITSEGVEQVGFGDIQTSASYIRPVSTDYGLVIEKINANAKVVANVDPTNESVYQKALQQGVAEAAGSTKPGQPGNLFIFSHSTDAPWNIARYNAVFFLLRELETGDRIIVYYQGRRFDYLVFDKSVVKPTDISFLTNRYDKPVLTLQTCDPPGTVLNRLIVRAQLVSS